VYRASYEDVAAAADGSRIQIELPVRLDLFVFGWGSYSHLLTTDARRRMLQAVRRRWPHAAVLLSYFAPQPRPSGLEGKAREALRGQFARSRLPAGSYTDDEITRSTVIFRGSTGFLALLSEDDVHAELAREGYRAVWAESLVQPVVLARPIACRSVDDVAAGHDHPTEERHSV
jgi:hypothetical protein